MGVQGIRCTRRRRARCTRARTRSQRGRIESRCCSGAVRGKHTSLAPGARARASARVLGPPLLLATQLHSAARDGPGRQWGWPRCGLTQSRAAAASCGGSERKAVLNLCTELPVPESHSVVGLPRRRDRGCGRWDRAARASPAHPSGAEDRPCAEVVDTLPARSARKLAAGRELNAICEHVEWDLVSAGRCTVQPVGAAASARSARAASHATGVRGAALRTRNGPCQSPMHSRSAHDGARRAHAHARTVVKPCACTVRRRSAGCFGCRLLDIRTNRIGASQERATEMFTRFNVSQYSTVPLTKHAQFRQGSTKASLHCASKRRPSRRCGGLEVSGVRRGDRGEVLTGTA